MYAAIRHSITALTAASLLAACTGEQGGATKTTGEPSVPPDAAPAAGAPQGGGRTGAGQGMGDMQGMGGGMMEEMSAHMQVMGRVAPDSMRAMLPMHRQMVANMLSQMNGEMRQMNMASDAAWTATVDSLRQDLVRMPELSAGELKAMMPAHEGRVSRLAAMHAAMMKGMR